MDWKETIESKQIWVVCFDMKDEPLFCAAFLTLEGAEKRVRESLGEDDVWEQIDKFIWEHRNGRDRVVIDHAFVGG
jgi:hypothetical protein